jgi:BirA family biotin operon repressor/biotin-[acetyl-CoA-carboxylase] ligase
MTLREGPYEKVARDLTGSRFSSIEYREATESTNDDAAALLGDERYGGHTIVAEYQRRGAGRKGRAWQATAGGSLLFTTILPGAVPVDRLWLVPFWTALAVGSALEGAGVTTTLQWPNDVLLRERKLAGILCRSQVTGSSARVACGVGLNVFRSPGDDAAFAFCDDVAVVDRVALLAEILRRFHRMLELLGDPARLRADWEAAAQLPGRRYRIALDGNPEPFDATALGLGENGSLRVQRDDGSVNTVEMADARVLR